MWKDANNGTHDLRCVPEEHTDFRCFLPISSYTIVYPIMVMPRYRTRTPLAAKIAWLASVSGSKADVNPGRFATDIWNATDAVDRHHRENKLERNRSRRYRGRTNGEIRKNSSERFLMAIILFPLWSFTIYSRAIEHLLWSLTHKLWAAERIY